MVANFSKLISDGAAAAPFAGRLRVTMLALLAALSLSACATAPMGGTAMRDGGIVMPPSGWMDYCGRNAGDPSCKVVVLDTAHWKQLLALQANLRAVRQVDDQKSFGRAEYWQVASKSGDCEDIALAARQRLLADGWPASAVRLATAWTEAGSYHTVLTVDGVRDNVPVTYVLDNRFATVLSWQKLEEIGYRFHIRQAARGPNWVTIQS